MSESVVLPVGTSQSSHPVITCFTIYSQGSAPAAVDRAALEDLCRGQSYAPGESQIREFFDQLALSSGGAQKLCLCLGEPCGDGSSEPIAVAFWNLVLDHAELEYLVVAPRVRGQGRGRNLMTLSHSWLTSRGIHECLLEVAADNVSAAQLYVSLGYTVIGTRRRYYSNGQDAQVMKWVASGFGEALKS